MSDNKEGKILDPRFKHITLSPNGYDPGTWGEAKQVTLYDAAYSEMEADDSTFEDGFRKGVDYTASWAARQIGVEEHELAQGK